MEITLALGGGGIRGIAHLGVIEVLEANGFKVRAVAGTSFGGLVGAAYAAGISPAEIVRAIKSFNMGTLARRRPEDGPALLGHASLVDVLSSLLHGTRFGELHIPFACTAVDLTTCKEVHLKDGLVIDAVLATSAFPGVLPPRKAGKSLLVDGGVLDPVPVALARSLKPGLPVVAVALQPPPEEWGKAPEADFIETTPMPIPAPIIHGLSNLRIGQAMRIFAQSMDINSRMLTELRLRIDRPEVLIRPDVIRFGIFESADADALIELGRKAAAAHLGELRKAVSLEGRIRRLLRPITPVDTPGVLREDPDDEREAA